MSNSKKQQWFFPALQKWLVQPERSAVINLTTLRHEPCSVFSDSTQYKAQNHREHFTASIASTQIVQVWANAQPMAASFARLGPELITNQPTGNMTQQKSGVQHDLESQAILTAWTQLVAPLTVHPQATFPLVARDSSASCPELVLVITAGYFAISINTEQSFKLTSSLQRHGRGLTAGTSCWTM